MSAKHKSGDNDGDTVCVAVAKLHLGLSRLMAKSASLQTSQRASPTPTMNAGLVNANPAAIPPAKGKAPVASTLPMCKSARLTFGSPGFSLKVLSANRRRITSRTGSPVTAAIPSEIFWRSSALCRVNDAPASISRSVLSAERMITRYPLGNPCWQRRISVDSGVIAASITGCVK